MGITQRHTWVIQPSRQLQHPCVASRFQVAASSVTAVCQTPDFPPPPQRKCFKKRTNYLRPCALLSWGSVCKGQAEFTCNLDSPAVHLHNGAGSETEPVPPEDFTGCSDTQCVIRFASFPPGGKSSLVGRSSEAPRAVTTAPKARAAVTMAFLTFMPGQSTGLQHLVSVSGTRQQPLPKMGFPNDVFSNKSNMFQPCVLARLYI